ncbi:unnamed protein product [Trichogramma brassicae]|uniref:Reverse transcriptase domain-containing protein n=1 Tax=Trichogramma brassicae TaxID=86971 RepID=A0A6H5HYA6_9HYME|nr:unnamed protein product [Trichogramma brassicae]
METELNDLLNNCDLQEIRIFLQDHAIILSFYLLPHLIKYVFKTRSDGIVQLEGQLKAAQSRPKSLAEVAQKKVVHKERPKAMTTAQAAGQSSKPKPTRTRKRSPKRERFVATVKATSALGVKTGEEIKAELFKAVDPVTANIGFDAIVKAKDSVIVEVRSRADLDRLLGSAGCKEKGLEVLERTASTTWPRLAIFDVPNSFSEDKVLWALASQNGDMLAIRTQGRACALGSFSRVVITGQKGDETPWAAMVVLSPNITATHLRQYSSAHCVCVELSGAFGSVVVISQYHQFSHEPEVHIDYLDLLLSRLGSRRIIIGMDLNGTSPQWSSRVQTADERGLLLEEMTSEKIAPKSAVNSLMVGDSSTTGWTETATAFLDGFLADPTTPDRVIPPSRAADTALWSELEVLKSVRSMKSGKCPGEDMIEADMIKAACGYGFLRPLTCLMNACLRLGRLPSGWKSGAICVLLKSLEKDRSALKSYRPVCLLPVLSKVLERLIRWRLLPVISNEEHASSRQFGFRAGRSTADAIGLAKSIVSECGKPLAFGILFDITGAFDNLRWHSVMEKLATRSCPGNIWQLVRDYLGGRTVSLTSDGSRVAREVKKGAPQGSILGPDMWNMCMDPVLREVQERGGEIVAYADDLLLLVPGDSRPDCEARAQSMTDVIAGWASRLCLEISRSKTEMILLKNNAKGGTKERNAGTLRATHQSDASIRRQRAILPLYCNGPIGKISGKPANCVAYIRRALQITPSFEHHAGSQRAFRATLLGNMAKIRPRDDSSVGGQVMRRSMIFVTGRPGPGRRRSR